MSNDLINAVNEQAKAMAVTWQLKTITDQAARRMRQPPPRKPICGFCSRDHPTTQCRNVPQKDKKAMAINKRVCILCCGRANHHPAKCGALRQRNVLCTRRECGRRIDLHHTTMCPLPEPTGHSSRPIEPNATSFQSKPNTETKNHEEIDEIDEMII
uniref:Nucleic-acid-binding protein from transposon X-element n=1 Tax=Caenorhabditis tropicalis TaxID=1561998 RepID=A0A1I7TX94_9PELO